MIKCYIEIFNFVLRISTAVYVDYIFLALPKVSLVMCTENQSLILKCNIKRKFATIDLVFDGDFPNLLLFLSGRREDPKM